MMSIDIVSLGIGIVIGVLGTVGVIAAWILPDVLKQLVKMARKGEI